MQSDVGEEHIGAATEAIYGGVIDSDGAANSAVVALKIGDGAQTFELCSASVIAPNVLLTARHCVSNNLTTSVACDSKGLSGNGAQVGADNDPTTMHVFLGASPDLRGGLPVANGKAIFHPTSAALCNADIALLVLDRNITGVTPLAVRLTTKTIAGEKIRSVGYGESDSTYPVGTRLRKDGVGVLAIGSTVTAQGTELASSEMEVGLSICQGDSGGPAISEKSGAIVGVVSRGGSCTDDFGHIYTLASGFGSLFTQAFAVAGGAPIDEGRVAASADAGTGSNGTGTGTTTNGADAGVDEPANDGTNSALADGGASHGSNLNLRAGANAGACSARIAPAADGDGTGAFAVSVALSLLVLRTRRRR